LAAKLDFDEEAEPLTLGRPSGELMTMGLAGALADSRLHPRRSAARRDLAIVLALDGDKQPGVQGLGALPVGVVECGCISSEAAVIEMEMPPLASEATRSSPWLISFASNASARFNGGLHVICSHSTQEDSSRLSTGVLGTSVGSVNGVDGGSGEGFLAVIAFMGKEIFLVSDRGLFGFQRHGEEERARVAKLIEQLSAVRGVRDMARLFMGSLLLREATLPATASERAFFL